MKQVYLVHKQDAPPTQKFDFASTITLDDIDSLAESKQEFACWLIDISQDIDSAQEILANIRQQFTPNLYLRPVVFFYSQLESRIEKVLMSADGFFPLHQDPNHAIEGLLSQFAAINQWIDKLPHLHTATDTDLIFRILRLIVSRNKEIMPIATVQQINGYIYPVLNPIMQKSDSSFFKILDFLESQHLITGSFVSHCYLCCQCYCAFLNFKESCPQCGAEDISTDELIHHFRCAHVAEAYRFKQADDSLICPKCDKHLKHIGVDYDKPSLISHCNQCNFDFQEAKIITQCFNCQTLTEPENQISRTIKSYESTAIGRNAAIFGLDTLFHKIISSKVKFLPETTFRQFLEIEIERIKRYKISTSTLGILKFIDIDKIYLQQGTQAEIFFEELSMIFKSSLRLSDIITSQNQSIFIVLMIETPKKQAQLVMDRLTEKINELLVSNIDFEAKTPTTVEKVSVDTDLDRLLENFIKQYY
ncbi:MAG: hypothetical protein GQ582_10220 [Methyloprofundus sp.]|nr:hypothetical protein [Methyloprofundus sp.]